MSDFRFTPRVLRRVRRHVAEGLLGPEIARRLGCDYNSLRTVCARHGVSLRRCSQAPVSAPLPERLELMGRSGPARVLAIPIGEFTDRGLAEEARRRGADKFALTARLLELVVSDDLFNAILG